MCTWSGPAERTSEASLGTTRVMHGPRNMVALGLHDLWAAGVRGAKMGSLRLPGQRTQGWADNQLAHHKRGGRLSAK